jgi:hypothetical protein
MITDLLPAVNRPADDFGPDNEYDLTERESEEIQAEIYAEFDALAAMPKPEPLPDMDSELPY